MKRPNNKLDFKKLRPFVINKKISDSNYKLSLLKTIKIYPVFYISLFELISKLTKPQKENIEILTF